MDDVFLSFFYIRCVFCSVITQHLSCCCKMLSSVDYAKKLKAQYTVFTFLSWYIQCIVMFTSWYLYRSRKINKCDFSFPRIYLNGNIFHPVYYTSIGWWLRLTSDQSSFFFSFSSQPSRSRPLKSDSFMCCWWCYYKFCLSILELCMSANNSSSLG